MKAAVVGAGIVGRLLAWRLSRRACHVTLFDSSPLRSEGSCAFASAGMLTPYAEVGTAMSDVVELGLASLSLWPEYWRELPDSLMVGRQGSLVLCHGRDQHELTLFLGLLANRFPQKACFERLNKDALSQLEPTLASFGGEVCFFPDEAFVDSQALMSLLEQQLVEQGVVWCDGVLVTDIKPGVVSYADQSEQFDWVFDCRGNGAKTQFSDLRGVRGESILLHAPEVSLSRPIRMLHPRYPLYIVPRPDGHMIVGASELESESMAPITVRSTLELLSAAYSLSSAFAEASVVKTMVHCRPAFSDNLPKLLAQSGLVAINGLYRHGILLAPLMVETALQYVFDEVVEYNRTDLLEEVAA